MSGWTQWVLVDIRALRRVAQASVRKKAGATAVVGAVAGPSLSLVLASYLWLRASRQVQLLRKLAAAKRPRSNPLLIRFERKCMDGCRVLLRK